MNTFMQMYRKDVLFTALIIQLMNCQGVKTECNVCAVNPHQACVSENEFRICVNGDPTGNILTCPQNQKCSTSGTCQDENDPDAIWPCLECRKCNAGNVFACIDTKRFALCLGTDSLSDIEGTCQDDLVCNIRNANICGSPANGNVPTCSYADDTTIPPPTTSTTTTTPSPATQPNNYCAYVQQAGRYPVGITPTTTCKQYVLCIEHNGAWVGALYYCPHSTYFDDSTRACKPEMPARCNSAVRSLSLYNLELL